MYSHRSKTHTKQTTKYDFFPDEQETPADENSLFCGNWW